MQRQACYRLFFFIFYFSAGNKALSLFIIDMGKVGKLDGSEDGSAPSGARGGLDGGGGGMGRGKEQQRRKRKRRVEIKKRDRPRDRE